MVIDIASILFEQFLRISPALLSQYSTVQDRLLYLIFIPHVILLLFLWSFGYWVAGKGHAGIRILLSLAAYIYLVWAGWYGSFIIPILLAWFPLLLIATFLFFILSRILHPMSLSTASGVMKAVIDKAAGKPLETRRATEEVAMIRKTIADLEKTMNDSLAAADTEGEKRAIRETFGMQIAAYKTKLDEKELVLKQTKRLI
jgi:hypothetical protein